jgi:prepilin-type N-terminal cleavage/methylation domain-containing protein
MFIKIPARGTRAWTLVEMMVAVAVFSIAGLALSTIFVFSIRSFAALTNYAMLDKENREAMDKMTREIREAKQVVNFTTNGASSLSLVNGDNNTITYTFSPGTKQMIRSVSTGETTVMLTNCDLLAFSLFMRAPIATNSLQPYPIATNDWPNTVKVIQLTWRTSTALPNAQVNSENVQTARVVIRKQQDN